jgi:hypothetical protein
MDISKILIDIKDMVRTLGFVEIEINNRVNFVMGNTYCIPQYVENIGFLIEYTDSEGEAQKNRYEDSDAFPIDMGEKAILGGIFFDLLSNVPELQYVRISASTLPLATNA